MAKQKSILLLTHFCALVMMQSPFNGLKLNDFKSAARLLESTLVTILLQLVVSVISVLVSLGCPSGQRCK